MCTIVFATRPFLMTFMLQVIAHFSKVSPSLPSFCVVFVYNQPPVKKVGINIIVGLVGAIRMLLCCIVYRSFAIKHFTTTASHS